MFVRICTGIAHFRGTGITTKLVLKFVTKRMLDISHRILCEKILVKATCRLERCVDALPAVRFNQQVRPVLAVRASPRPCSRGHDRRRGADRRQPSPPGLRSRGPGWPLRLLQALPLPRPCSRGRIRRRHAPASRLLRTARCAVLFTVWHFPIIHTHQNAIRILDGVDMAVVLLDHLHRGAHLFGEQVHIHALAQSERGVGVPEAIGRAVGAKRPFE